MLNAKDDILTPSDFDLFDPPPPPQPVGPTWIDYPVVTQHLNENTLYADIINHYGGTASYPDRMTQAHETTHMVNADIRNAKGDGLNPVAFYVGENHACVMTQPKMKKSDIARFVPGSLQGDRYGTYVTGQRDWDDSPLYLYDEWIAYTNGGAVCVEQVQAGTYRDGWTDGVMGLLEFSVYACATVLSIEQNDPDYLTNTPDYLNYTRWCLNRALDVYSKGSVMDDFKWDKQDSYLNTWKTASEAADLRNVLTKYFEGVWLSG